MKDEKEHPKEDIAVAVVTTSGRWPSVGFDPENANQKVRHALERAANKLKIVSTDGWLATVEGREIKPDASYVDNGLTGKVLIDFGPREGGGGDA